MALRKYVHSKTFVTVKSQFQARPETTERHSELPEGKPSTLTLGLPL